MRTTRCQRLGLLLLLASTLAVVAVCAPPRYNSVLGTTSIGSLYQFTRLPMLEETGQRIAAMGSSAIKVFVDGPDAGWQSVLSLPFTHIFLWYRTDSTAWRDGLSAQAAAEEYKLTFEFARSLLLNYSGAGRTFFVGQWEVDWELLPGYNLSYTPTPQSVQGLIDYLTVRQAAVDDARRLVPHAAVDVRCYTEVNRVVDVRLQPNLTRVVNAVLPHVRLDAVSYSAYDVQQAEQADVNRTLDYIAQHFNSSSTELFIGEFALPAAAFNYDGVQHAEANLAMARKFLSWRGRSGKDSVMQLLYWEFYNNERDETGRNRGFWLIDDQDVKQPLYHAFHAFYQAAHRYVSDYRRQHAGDEPSRPTFLDEFALPFLRHYNASSDGAEGRSRAEWS